MLQLLVLYTYSASKGLRTTPLNFESLGLQRRE
jgi:hypothetical protein